MVGGVVEIERADFVLVTLGVRLRGERHDE